MCYRPDAEPPIYGAPVTATTSAPLTLSSTDGTEIAAYLTLPAEPRGAGVLVLPDNRGLHPFYERLTVRLAEQGHPALAVDYYARTAGAAYRDRAAEFGEPANLAPHLRALTRDGLYADFTAAIGHLRAADGANAPGVVSLGFCVGGRFAFLTALERFALRGAIGLYGFPGELFGAPGPTRFAAGMTAPILGLFAGADQITPESIREFDEALTAAGRPHEFVDYPGMPHGFFDAHAGGHRTQCADVWRRVMAFVANPPAA